jgi:multiple sugar transport system permease protein
MVTRQLPAAPSARVSAPTSARRPLGRFSEVVYLLPAVVLLVAITVLPLFYLLYNSLTQWDLRRAYLGKTFIGLANYASMLGDSLFRDAVRVTILATIGVVVVELTLGLLLALLFNRDFAGKRVARSLFLLPLITTPIIVGLTWRMLFNAEFGMIDYFIRLVGLSPPNWLADPALALPSIILAETWQITPFVTLMFVAGLQAIPPEPYEAAKVDGASAWQRFLYITIPLLRPVIFLALIFRATDAVRMFDLIYVMTGGGPANATQTLNMYVFKVGFTFLNMGYGSALATLLMLVCIVISFVLVKYSGIELETNR